MHRGSRRAYLWNVAVPAAVVLGSTVLLITSGETGASPWLAVSFIFVGILTAIGGFLRIRGERCPDGQSRTSSDGPAADESERRPETPR